MSKQTSTKSTEPDKQQATLPAQPVGARRKTRVKEAATSDQTKSDGASLKELKRVISALQSGKLDERANSAAFTGEWREAFEAVNGLAGTLGSLIADMNTMSSGHDRGDIDLVIDAGKYHGDLGKMATGINTMVAGHIAVKKKAMACIAEFGNGNFDAVLEKFPGKKAFINDTIETLRSNLKTLIADMNTMSFGHDRGDIDVAIDAGKFHGDFGKMASGINTMVAGHIAVKKKAMACIAEFANGNFEAVLEKFAGKKAFINDNIETLRANLKALVADTNMLSAAAVQGKLATRADATMHRGDFHRIVQGVNDTLDAVIGPLNVAATYVDQISKGAIPAKITDNYNGDFNTIKNNLNTCIDAVNALVADANSLSVAAVEGKLATRADVSKHQGDFRRIVQGVNSTLDAVIGPLNVAATYVDQISKGAIPAKITDNYNGDFNTIKSNLNTCIDAVNALVADANLLSVAAIEGKLATRADAGKHQGDFRKVVQGVNDTLDAVIGPLNNIREVIEGLGRNDMSVSLKGEYRGDFLTLKDAFERALEEVNSTLHEIVDAVEQVGQSSEQLRAASQNMASTSEEQSSSVEEVTSSLEETDTQVKANTDAANTANQLVMGTSQAASSGQIKMGAMTAAMNEINASAQNIGKIIKVIDEIAFQTNLLALNAAVEAARAGQHGRGFAVVAQEVRNLAGRSAKAARETAELIENSVKQVAGGVGIAKETSEALDQIVGNVVKVKDLVGEIATASAEQARGVSQINIAMNQVAKAAQEGSQQSEELASSSAELASVADRMRDSVRRFKLRDRARLAQTLPGLEGLSPEMLAQLRALLGAQQQGRAPKAAARPVNGQRPASPRALAACGKSPKTILPLDQDERGFGEF